MMAYLTDSLCSCESSAAFSALTKRVAHREQYVRWSYLCLWFIILLLLLLTLYELTMASYELRKIKARLNRRG